MVFNEMKIGIPVVVADKNYIHITVTRLDENAVRSVQRYPANGEVVLDITSTLDGSSNNINKIDMVFWNLTIDGSVATERDMVDLSQFKGLETNPEERKITLKRG